MRYHSAVHTVIKELQDEAIDPQSLLNLRGIPRKQELIVLTESLEEVLKELDGIISKYQNPAQRERKIWNQLRLATKDLDGIRSKLTFHVTAINAFTSSLSHGSLAQIETVLRQLVSEVQQGRRHPSLESLHETGNDSSVWGELESELAREGISGAELAKHKVSIKIFVQGLLSIPNVGTTSLVGTGSLIESGKDERYSEFLSPVPFGKPYSEETYSEFLSPIPFAMGLSPEHPAGWLIIDGSKGGSLASVDEEEYDSVEEEYESADGDFTPIHAGASNSTIPQELAEQLSLDGFPAQCNQVLRPEQPPTTEDALAYMHRVKTVLVHQRYLYDLFVCVLQNWKMDVLDTHGVIEWVSTLFIHYPELIQYFNAFLPPGYRTECGMVDNHHAFRVIVSNAAYIRIPDLEAMQPLDIGKEDLHTGLLKWIDPASLHILQPYSGIATNWTTEQSNSQASGAIQARMTFPRRLKAFPARTKVTKKTAADKGQSNEAHDIIYVSGRASGTMDRK